MILAYHVIFGAYGFWLPNDPRGSWSDFVGAWDLYHFGRATKVEDRRSHAWDDHDADLRRAAKNALKYSPVILTEAQIRVVAAGFADVARASGYALHACAILPAHGHLVIGRHDYHVEQIVRRLKQAAGLRLKREGLHPLADQAGGDGAMPCAFAARCWKCFIDSDAYARAAIRYVERNPLKEGRPSQEWSFLAPWGSGAPSPRGFSSRG